MKNKEIIIKLSKELARELAIGCRQVWEEATPKVRRVVRQILARGLCITSRAGEKTSRWVCRYWRNPVLPQIMKWSGASGRLLCRHYGKVAVGVAAVLLVGGGIKFIDHDGAKADTGRQVANSVSGEKEQSGKVGPEQVESSVVAAKQGSVVKKPASVARIVPQQVKQQVRTNLGRSPVSFVDLNRRVSKPVDLGRLGYERQMQRARYHAQQSSSREMRRYQSHLNSRLRARGVR